MAFPQKEELDLVRENHDAVMRELKRMQDDPTYVSSWEPRTLTPKVVTQVVEAESRERISMAVG